LLPNVIYEFKFIVDNVWKCSKDYPTLIDEKGNLNNFLDLRYTIENNQNQINSFSLNNNNIGLNLNSLSNSSTWDSNFGNNNNGKLFLFYYFNFYYKSLKTKNSLTSLIKCNFLIDNK